MMHSGIDAVDIDIQPQTSYNEYMSIFYISFILVVSFFVLNMFVGVVVENFQNCQSQQELEYPKSDNTKTQEQKSALQDEDSSYFSSFSPWRIQIHHICTNKYFELSITILVILNVLTMSLEYYRMPHV